MILWCETLSVSTQTGHIETFRAKATWGKNFKDFPQLQAMTRNYNLKWVCKDKA